MALKRIKNSSSYDNKETLSFNGEKLMPEVGAECCFSQETYEFQGEKKNFKPKNNKHSEFNRGNHNNLGCTVNCVYFNMKLTGFN